MQKDPSNRECCNPSKRWCLEGFFLDNGQPVKISLKELPLQIGRGIGAEVAINQPSISRLHAKVTATSETICLSDCNSRNGTFVNHMRISGPTVLYPGDYVHLGSCEFRIVLEHETLDEHRAADDTWRIREPGRREFQKLLSEHAIISRFQPVVRLDDAKVFAFESLGRGIHPQAPSKPDELFRIAKHLGYVQELSRTFRQHALEQAKSLPKNYEYFINVHPDELLVPEVFIGEMGRIRDIYSDLDLVLEVPESLINENEAVAEIRKGLNLMGIQVAYDDFGIGQSRLLELAEIPPDYLKFDRTLVNNIHQAAPQRQKLVEMLVRFANEIGTTTVAEGIETVEEWEACRQIGFQCGQGFLFGKPMLPDQARSLSAS